MSIYRFSKASAIVEATFRYANDRSPVALLQAKEGADADQLSSIRRAIELMDWKCVPVMVDGKELLQVDGFKDAGQLSAFLIKSHFAQGQPHITEEPGDHVTRTAKEWLEDSSLKAAGWLNLVGDAALLASGLKSGRNKEITAGVLYTVGAGVLARYGNIKTEHHVREVSERVGDYLKKQAIELPEDSGLFSIMKDKCDGVMHNADRFFSRYPSEVMLSAYTLGALTMLQSGMKQRDPWGMAYGASSVGFKAASLLIPEKPKTEAEKKGACNQAPMGRLIDWVQEKPLRVFGFGSLVTDTLLGLSALREYKTNPKQRSYIFKFITTGTYLLADIMMAISSKGHANADGRFDSEEQRRIEALAAEAIARQPQDMQEALANQVGGFLVTQPEMKGTAAEISHSIMEQVKHMRHNPWAARTDSSLSLQPNR